jgi:hypothetical protein
VETLTDHGKCCFVWLLGYQTLTDGICDDVLDVVEGIAGETVIELMQEKNNMRERYDSDKKMYPLVWATKLLLAAIGLVFPALVFGIQII